MARFTALIAHQVACIEPAIALGEGVTPNKFRKYVQNSSNSFKYYRCGLYRSSSSSF
jgi:hypothetical protein